MGVTVYERVAARHEGAFGCRVTIDPDGDRALRNALPPDLYNTFTATCAEPPRHLTVYSEVLEELFTTAPPVVGRRGAALRYTSHMTLRQLLLTGIEDVVRFGKEFVRYERRPDGRIAAFFSDGTTAVGDVLVGADGADSRVRRQLLPQAGLQDCGFTTAYGKVDLLEAARLLPWEMLRGISVVRGASGPVLVTQPMDFLWDSSGELKGHVHGLDAALLSTWAGRRHDDTRDHLTWWLFGPSGLFPAAPERLRGADLVEAVGGMTRHWDPALHTLLGLSEPDAAAATRAVVSRPAEPREATGVTLLGDAGHVRLPDPGEGANAALAAAWSLSGLLAEAAAGRPVAAAIRDHETRLPASGFDFSAYWKRLYRQARADTPVIGPVPAAGPGLRAVRGDSG
ncbi:hypothetical protein [Microtetraspora sp. NBRC 13810]|uniref:hypothetical protein n=1 Tax=Microtetraspora sp. NBRC 13810 TaxID=3030990 RepID=UPI002556B172|nr:hypothetical protein [Microtetraspora sp. NBRC 13810]